jgi:protein-disulfide isomerase
MPGRTAPLALGLAVLLVACGAGEAPLPAEETLVAEAPAAAGAKGAAVPKREVGYARGAAGAGVEVVEFSDFGCAACGEFARDVYPALHREWVESGRVRWRYVPTVMGGFANGLQAADAAECAAEQDGFWAMHDALNRAQREWQARRAPEPHFQEYASEAALDMARFESCYRERRGAARIRSGRQTADLLGVRVSPTFLLNGRRVEGALPLREWRRLLAAAEKETARLR